MKGHYWKHIIEVKLWLLVLWIYTVVCFKHSIVIHCLPRKISGAGIVESVEWLGCELENQGIVIGSGEGKRFCSTPKTSIKLLGYPPGRLFIWEGAYPGINWTMCEAARLDPFSTKVKNVWTCISISQGSTFVHGVWRNNFSTKYDAIPEFNLSCVSHNTTTTTTTTINNNNNNNNNKP